MSGIEDVVKEEEETEPKKGPKLQRLQDVVVYVHVFRGDITNIQPSKKDLSALVITGTGDVYGTGWNTLIGRKGKGKSPVPMKQDGPHVLEEYVKVEALSGLGLRKIAVGLGFGVAVTHDNQLYFWGGGPQMMFDSDVVVMLQKYEGSTKCICRKDNARATHKLKGGAELLTCTHRSSHYIYVGYSAYSPPRKDVAVEVLAMCDKISLNCLNCGEPCTYMSLLTYPDLYHKVNHCQPCDLLRKVEMFDALPPTETKPPHKLLAGILDMDCSSAFFCTLSENNDLIFYSWKNSILNQTPVKTPGNVTLKAVYCGARQFAVLTDTGSLFTFGGDQAGKWSRDFSKQSLTVTEVITPAPVDKVCCGDQLIVCLLADQTIWVSSQFTSLKLFRQSLLNCNTHCSTDIASYHCLNGFFVKHKQGDISIYEYQSNNKISSLTGADYDGLITGLLKPLDLPLTTLKRGPADSTLPSWQRNLYGGKQLADMTLKLADGEFPAHRLVLFGSSNYFKNIITNQETSTSLDMTSYNPRAYKVLLQYFYQVQPDDLELDDLLDLHSIATSYNEPDIVNDVISVLMSLTNIDNVLQILAKAKLYNNKALIKECEKIMSSPPFKDKVIRALIKDPSKSQVVFEN